MAGWLGCARASICFRTEDAWLGGHSTYEILACHLDVNPGRFRGDRLNLLFRPILVHILVQTRPGAPLDEERLGLVPTLHKRPLLELNRITTLFRKSTS